MEYEWDEAKRLSNLAKHACDFCDVDRFDWNNSITIASGRRGEERYQAFGFFESRFHTVVFTPRVNVRRIISFRKADPREIPKQI